MDLFLKGKNMVGAKWLGWILLVVLALGACAVAYGSWRWEKRTELLLLDLEAGRRLSKTKRYDVNELKGLPAPVQRYFRAVLKDGQPIISAASIEHIGTFNMGEASEQWKPFTSQQRVSTLRPGFDWNARIMMFPGVPVLVHDAYVNGVGILRGAMFGLIPVVVMESTPELARGEFMRFFAEAAWYPTALLPSQGVQWKAIDDHSAQATMTDEELSLTLTFRFQADGTIDTFRAEARERVVNGRTVTAPWQGRVWNYETKHGLKVPTQGEIAWALPEGEKPYWRGMISAIKYEFRE
jgi:hypothetical protein